jgi:hypothetical protein
VASNRQRSWLLGRAVGITDCDTFAARPWQIFLRVSPRLAHYIYVPKPSSLLLTVRVVERRIHSIRGLNIMLDRDLAVLYRVKNIAP